MYRLIFAGSVLLWLAAMAALFVRDVLPVWTAQEAPPMTREQFETLPSMQLQYGLFNGNGQRLGTAWNNIQTAGQNTTLYGTLEMAGIGPVPELRIETITEFDDTGSLDNFSLDVFGVPMTKISIKGERRGPYFPAELQIGPLRRQASLDLSSSRLIGETLRPFTFLPTLQVGQSWRMQLLNPLSAALGQRAEFTPVVAKVVRKETIRHDGRDVECFVVETSPQQVRAWVDARGEVLVQEVEMPGFGRLVVRQESYNEQARERARQRIRSTATYSDQWRRLDGDDRDR